MKIALITPCSQNISAFGARSISSFLKARGHQVKVIALPIIPEVYRNEKGVMYAREYKYPEHTVHQLVELVKDCGLVGISFMTQYYSAAIQLTRALKAGVKAPIIWGGVHPSVRPEQSLDFADIVCVGEGEEAVLELVQRLESGRGYEDVANLCFKVGGKIVKNPVRPLIQDIDALPFLDYGPEDNYVGDLVTNDIVPLDVHQFERSLARVPYYKGRLLRSFMYFTTRGCPYSCTYCVNDFYKQLYGTHGFIRKVSVKRVVDELAAVIRKYPFIEEIEFCDDNFALRPVGEIEEFARLYKEKINLPFQLLISPLNIIEEKMVPLLDAGLVFVETGIQSAAEGSKELYHRKIEEARFFNAVGILHKYRERMAAPCYHLILDNPFESIEDTLETYKLTLRLPRPFWFKRSSLVAFPGTLINTRYREEGLIKDEEKEVFYKILEMPSHCYVNFLFLLNSQNYPIWLCKLLSRPGLVKAFNKPSWIPFWGMLESMVWTASKIKKGLKALLRRDFKTLARRFVLMVKGPRGVPTSRPS